MSQHLRHTIHKSTADFDFGCEKTVRSEFFDFAAFYTFYRRNFWCLYYYLLFAKSCSNWMCAPWTPMQLHAATVPNGSRWDLGYRKISESNATLCQKSWLNSLLSFRNSCDFLCIFIMLLLLLLLLQNRMRINFVGLFCNSLCLSIGGPFLISRLFLLVMFNIFSIFDHTNGLI